MEVQGGGIIDLIQITRGGSNHQGWGNLICFGGGGELGSPPPPPKSLRILILLIVKSIVRPNLNFFWAILHFVDVQRVPPPPQAENPV